MFSFAPKTQVYDVLFEESGNRVLRDRILDLNDYSLTIAIQESPSVELLRPYKDKLKELCKCERMVRVTYSGSLYDYVLKKKELPEIGRENL